MKQTISFIVFSLVSINIWAQLNIVSISPQANSNNVASSANINMSFDLTIDPTTLNAATIIVRGNETGVMTGVLTGGGSTTITFNPTNNFKLGEVISITITTSLLSQTGFALTRSHTYSFTAISGPPPSTPVTFAQRRINFTSGSSLSRDISALDFDKDGDLDLIVGVESPQSVTELWVNDGGQRFCNSIIGNYKIAEVHDIDGDGDFDSFGPGGNQVNLNWYRNEGNGGPFTTVFLAGTNVMWAATGGDLDSDGDIDAVAMTLNGNGTSSLKWFANNGAGVFTLNSITATITSGVETQTNLYLADINTDGALDILVYRDNTNNIAWYENNGAQVFTERIIISDPANLRLSTADVDGDGDLDILSASSTSVVALSWYENDGNETFTLHSVPVTSPNLLNNVKGTDVDGDSDMDLVAGGYWFENDGVEIFTQRIVTPGLVFSSGGSVYSFGTNYADLDSDGDMDVLTLGYLDNGFRWQENVQFMNVTTNTPSNAAFSVTANSNITVTFDQPIANGSITANSFRVISNLRGLINGTFSGGGTNTITFNPTNDFLPGEKIEVSINEKIVSLSGHRLEITYGFDFKVRTPVAGSPSFTASSIMTHATAALWMDVADVDGDGDLDAISCTASQFFWHQNNGNGNFSSIPITTSASPRRIFATDHDNDGDMDVIMQTSSLPRLYLNDGNENFSESQGSLQGTIFELADVNRDGDTDAMAGIRWQDRNCNTYSIATLPTLTGTASAMTAADLDNDGDIDLFRSSTSGSSFLLNDGYLNYSNNAVTGAGHLYTELADLDGDGDLDILGVQPSAAIVWYDNNITTASQNFGVKKTIGALAADPRWVVATDLDGDGDLDVAAISRTDDKIVWYRNQLNEASANFGVAQLLPAVSDGPILIKSGDINGDGKMDLVVLSDIDSELNWFANASALPNITSFTPTSGPIGTIVTITGSNFSTTPANNTVRFNGTTAVVTASTATSITTTVPTGATTGTISVTVAGNTATSASIFTVSTPSPTITSFTPTSGPVGTTVAINGTNFSTTPANNIVYFGATRGTVTAATSTQIEVTVPVGATFQPISVLVNGLVTYTRQPFIVNFGCSQIIDASAFAPKVDVTTGLEPYAIALGDFDQNGKIDMATANYSDNTISIFPNTSSGPGNVSYASKIDFSTGTGRPYSLSIGDFDGDGKQDVAVANETTNTVSVFRNTSTGPGNINFAGKIDFATGLFPHGVTSTDFNLDGKVDLAVTSDTDDVVSVFRNTSSGPGVINFGLRIDFPTGQAAQDVSNGDLDGDGLFDLVVTNYTSNTISVFQNTSTAGSITFAAKVDFPTGDTPNSVSIGDLDGDGKADIAVANAASNNVSLFRNTSSGVGSIAFAVQADLPAGVGAFGVAMSDLTGDGKPDLAVPDFGDKVAVFQNTSTGAGNVGFATNQEFLTGDTPQAVAIGDLDGDGKADLAVANAFSSSISVLLNLVASLPPPTITGFSPTAGTIGTPVTINGTNFNTTSLNTIVKFNGVTAVITGSTPTSITTTVPAGTSSGTVMVTVGCNSATSAGSFIIIPVINITLQPSDFIACEGVTASFTTNSVGTSNITYQWQFSPNGPPAFVDIANGPNYSGATTNSLSINTTGAFGVGRYRCRINGDLAAEVITNDEGLFVNTLPSPPGTSGSSGCASTSIAMSASGGINGQYRWYTLSAGGTSIGGAVNDSYLSPLLSATTVYYVAINNGTCESARSSVTATVILLPSSPTVTGGIGCSPTATVSLNSSGGIDGQYRWYTVSTGGSPIAGETGSTYSTPPLSASRAYFVSINNGTCESPRISVLAEIKSCTPVIAATALQSPAGGQTSLDIATLVSTVISPIDINSITVVQQPISGAMASVTNGVLEVDYAGIPFAGTDRLTIEACDQTSNCAQQEITIEVAGDISVYNAISPNGDGKNEELTIQYIDILPSTKSNKVTIFNRWGDVVFSIDNYDNQSRSFHGLNNNGGELPTGVYYYRIDFTGGQSSITGYLSLRR